jgi:Flp pilus assembly secretin CpaC
MRKQIGRTAARSCGFGVVLSLAAALMVSPAGAADQIQVIVDQAKIMKLPERVATIVIGNPLIADISVQANGMMVVTGKGYGMTNVVMLDKGGTVLLETSVQVRPPRDGIVVVYRGVEKESYSCMPNCEKRITLGDTPKYFDAALAQTVTRTGQAQGSGAAAPAAQAPAGAKQ